VEVARVGADAGPVSADAALDPTTRAHAFVIRTNRTAHVFQAPSAEDADAWITAISINAQHANAAAQDDPQRLLLPSHAAARALADAVALRRAHLADLGKSAARGEVLAGGAGFGGEGEGEGSGVGAFAPRLPRALAAASRAAARTAPLAVDLSASAAAEEIVTAAARAAAVSALGERLAAVEEELAWDESAGGARGVAAMIDASEEVEAEGAGEAEGPFPLAAGAAASDDAWAAFRDPRAAAAAEAAGGAEGMSLEEAEGLLAALGGGGGGGGASPGAGGGGALDADALAQFPPAVAAALVERHAPLAARVARGAGEAPATILEEPSGAVSGAVSGAAEASGDGGGDGGAAWW
jgi:hypothetical protein